MLKKQSREIQNSRIFQIKKPGMQTKIIILINFVFHIYTFKPIFQKKTKMSPL